MEFSFSFYSIDLPFKPGNPLSPGGPGKPVEMQDIHMKICFSIQIKSYLGIHDHH
jgi:hypothetical protein